MAEKSSGNPESEGGVIARAARRAGITYRQARALFYGETTDPRFSVVERVRRASAAAQQEAEEARIEYRELLARIAACEAALGLQDPDFHRPQIDALRDAAGGPHRSMDRER